MASHIPISSFPTIHFKGISTPHIATHNSTATNPCSCKQCLCRYLYVPLPSGLSLKTHEGRLLVSEVPKAWVFGWGQSEWTCFYSNIKLPAGFGLSQRNGANQRYNYCFFFAMLMPPIVFPCVALVRRPASHPKSLRAMVPNHRRAKKQMIAQFAVNLAMWEI